MVTLEDFIKLDSSICGLDIDIRANGSHLMEIHRFGVGAWPGNSRTFIEENVYLEMVNPKVYIYLHPDPINTRQTERDTWGVIKDVIPKRLLNMEIKRIAPYTAGFRHKENNGTYYSIDLIAEKNYETPVERVETDNITFEELMEVET